MEIKKLHPRADILIEAMRSIGYTFESALADIIDNSLSASAKNIEITFDPIDCNISIIDDGIGMDKDHLFEAMRWGSKDPLIERDLNDLGRFGLGLKSASFSQCRKLIVVSTSDGVNINGLCWDLDFIRETEEWNILELTQEQIKNLPRIDSLFAKKSGTYVLWTNFDKIEVTSKDLITTIEQLLDYSADYLALVFHRYINRKISISINGRKLPSIDPFLTKNSFTQEFRAEDVVIKDKNGNIQIIKVSPYVLPHFNSLSQDERTMLSKHNDFRNKQGFYIYRNERLIIWGSWFRLVSNNPAFKNARVKVDIPNTLDEIWSIDVKKSSASIPSLIKNKLFASVNKTINKSKNIYTSRTHNPHKEQGYTCVWDTIKERDKTFYKINRELPMLNKLTESMNDEQLKLLDMILIDIENNIPKYEVFNQIANDNDDDVDEERDVLERLVSFIKISMPSSLNDAIVIIETVVCSEPYCKYENIKNEALEEVRKLYE